MVLPVLILQQEVAISLFLLHCPVPAFPLLTKSMRVTNKQTLSEGEGYANCRNKLEEKLFSIKKDETQRHFTGYSILRRHETLLESESGDKT
jgi:hypothetical protein